MNREEPPMKRVVAMVVGGFLGLIILVSIFKMSVTIGGGEAGVLFRTVGGGVNLDETYGEGFHIVAPWNDMYIFEVRQQELKEQMNVLSSNGLEIQVEGQDLVVEVDRHVDGCGLARLSDQIG